VSSRLVAKQQDTVAEVPDEDESGVRSVTRRAGRPEVPMTRAGAMPSTTTKGARAYWVRKKPFSQSES
jgi:hypothetical protein